MSIRSFQVPRGPPTRLHHEFDGRWQTMSDELLLVDYGVTSDSDIFEGERLGHPRCRWQPDTLGASTTRYFGPGCDPAHRLVT